MLPYTYYNHWDIWNLYHSVTFDGERRLILVNSETTVLDIKRLYSEWKEWIQLLDYSKYEPAFRAIGADPISESISLGSTFFLINGWRIKPYSRDGNLEVIGNLYTDPAGDAPFLPVDGDFSVNINTTVSSLVFNSIAQIKELEYSNYGDGVTIDTTSTYFGTEYPTGTRFQPVNNLVDAQTICRNLGFTKLYIKGNFTLGSADNVSGYSLYGEGATLNVTKTQITMITGCVTSNAHFYNAKIVGTQGGESNYHDCIIAGISNAHCHYSNCGFLTATPYTIQHSNTVGSGHITDLHNCYSDELTPIIDRNGAQMNQIYVNYSGRIKFINQNRSTNSGSVWINMNGGEVTIDSSCTAGQITISGTCKVINNSGGTVVNTEQLSTASEVWNTVAANFTRVGSMGKLLNDASTGGVNYGDMADAVRAELSPELALINTNIDAPISGIADDVWNAEATDYTGPASMGLKVNQTSADAAASLIHLITLTSNPAASKEDIADAVWNYVLETPHTAKQVMRIQAAALAGKVSGAGTGTETFKGLDGTTNRIVSTTDVNGNRTGVVVDGN